MSYSISLPAIFIPNSDYITSILEKKTQSVSLSSWILSSINWLIKTDKALDKLSVTYTYIQSSIKQLDAYKEMTEADYSDILDVIDTKNTELSILKNKHVKPKSIRDRLKQLEDELALLITWKSILSEELVEATKQKDELTKWMRSTHLALEALNIAPTKVAYSLPSEMTDLDSYCLQITKYKEETLYLPFQFINNLLHRPSLLSSRDMQEQVVKLDKGIKLQLPNQIYKDIDRFNTFMINGKEINLTQLSDKEAFVKEVCLALYEACQGNEHLFNHIMLLATQTTASQLDKYNRTYFSNPIINRDITTCYIRLELEIPASRDFVHVHYVTIPSVANTLNEEKEFYCKSVFSFSMDKEELTKGWVTFGKVKESHSPFYQKLEAALAHEMKQ